MSGRSWQIKIYVESRNWVVSIDSLFEAISVASQKLKPWYSIEVHFKNGEISLGIWSTINYFQLAHAPFQSSLKDGLRLLVEQLHRDSQPDGRYAKTPEFPQMFAETAKILNSALESEK